MAIVAITGATGAQQSAIAQAFEAAAWTVRRTSRAGGAGFSQADLASGEGLDDVLAGADVLAVTLPQDHRAGAMTRIAQTLGASAARAGIARIVFNPGGAIDENAPDEMFAELRAARDALCGAGVPVSVVQPTVFMDNLLAPWLAGPIVAYGVLSYPSPPQARIAWLSHATLADFMVAAATGKVDDYEIGGPENLAGAEIAERLSQHLGRKVVYQQQPLEDFAAGIAYAMGAEAGVRLSAFYARLADQPDLMMRDHDAATALGVVPESFVSFLERTNFGPT